MFRTAQKNIERELGAVRSVAKDVPNASYPQEAINLVDIMIGRVENLKRKVCARVRLCDAL